MKRYLLFSLLLLIPISFSLSYYSSLSGEGHLSVVGDYNINNNAALYPLFETNMFLFGDKIYSIDNSLAPMWNYTYSTYGGEPAILDGSLIVSGRESGSELSSFSLSGNLNWKVSKSGGFNSDVFLLDGRIVVYDSSQLYCYDKDGTFMWNLSLGQCDGGIVDDDKLYLACNNRLYSIDEYGTLLLNKSYFGAKPHFGIFGEYLVDSTNNKIYIYNKDGDLVDSLFYLSKEYSVDTNIAVGNEIVSCAENGLYITAVDSGTLYFSKIFPQYANCYSPHIFDFNDDGKDDVVFVDGSNLTIIDWDGNLLDTIDLGGSGKFSIYDTDGDKVVEILFIRNDGKFYLISTSRPDVRAALFVNESGFFANLSNVGPTVARGRLNITYLNNSSSLDYYIGAHSYAIVPIEIDLSELGEHSLSIVYDLDEDRDLSNNEDHLDFTLYGLDNRRLCMVGSQLYDFNNTSRYSVESKDIDNSGNNVDVVILDRPYYIDGHILYPVGDVAISFNNFTNQLLTNSTLYVYGKVFFNGNYTIYNVSFTVFVDDKLYYYLPLGNISKGEYDYNFTLSVTEPGTHLFWAGVMHNSTFFDANLGDHSVFYYLNVSRPRERKVDFKIDLSTLSLHNNYFNLIINNSGDFDDTIFVYSNSSLFKPIEIFSKKGTIVEYPIYLNISMGRFKLDINIISSSNNVSKEFDLNIGCVYDSDCPAGSVCQHSSCIALDSASYSSNESSVAVKENTSLEEDASPLTGMITGTVRANSELIYWFEVIPLLLIASFGVYVISFRFLEDRAIVPAIINLLLFGAIMFLYTPSNLPLVLIEEVVLSLFIFGLIRR